jgi:hypothetical protein
MRRILCCAALLTTTFVTCISAEEISKTGEVVVRSIAPNRVAVFIDTNADKIVDNGFLLTTDIPMHASIAVRFADAKLQFTDGYVRVISENHIYDLQVAGYPDSPATPRDKQVITLIGSALQHSSGDSGCDVQRAHERDAGSCYSYGSD